MDIVVVNGSPKGRYSITLQTVLFLEKLYPEHRFQVLNVGQQIKVLERDFSSVTSVLEHADLILFSYPVYTFMAPSQLHRFIELLKAHEVDLKDKFATQITTSKHFYDVTAHRYIQDNCQDLGMKFIKGLSADMDDLLTEKGRKEALDFFGYVLWCMEENCYEPMPVHLPHNELVPVSIPKAAALHTKGDVVIITDCQSDDQPLKDMIARFQAVLPCASRVVNIREYPFQGGCLGCFSCAVSGRCVYKDGFDEFLRSDIQRADAIVYAFTIKDHSMGSVFKMYDDRQFCNGHRTVTAGMPIGYLINGHYSAEKNLQMVIEGRAEVGGNFLAGVATNETSPETAIDQMAKTLAYAMAHRYVQPRNFYGIGGLKIFRDMIYLMRGMMKADHQYYKSHGLYDFPHKKKADMLKMYAVGALLSSQKIKAKMGNRMNEGMIAPYRKVLDKTMRLNR